MCYRTPLDLCLAAATCAGIEQCGQIKNLPSSFPSSFPSLAIPRIIWPIQPDIFDAATRQALRRIREDVCLAMFLYVVWMKKTFCACLICRSDASLCSLPKPNFATFNL